MKKSLNNKIKFLIFFVIVFILLVLCVLIIFYKKEKVQEEQVEQENIIPHSYTAKENPSDIGTNEYFNIKECIDKYYENNSNEFILEEIYLKNLKDSVYTYLVFGKQINIENNKSEDSGLLLILDGNNKIFKIASPQYIKELGIDNSITFEEIKEKINNGDIKFTKEIEYKSSDINEKTMVKKIYDYFKLVSKYDEQYAYGLLDNEYREKRFSGRNIGAEYLKENINNIYSANLMKMAVDDSNPYYTIYICLDNNGNYFIIKKDDQLMKYNIWLDTYTSKIDFFSKEYKSANEKRKAEINLDKFKQMLNMKDYGKAYNVLKKEFKEKYFPSQQDFEKYIKQNFFDWNSFEYETNVDEGNGYKVKTKILDKSELDSQNSITKRFKVELLENSEYSISFDI